ncbi:MAG: 1-acyl-sn-glycerol-3-phosphate acyltransferase [Muribaculaceae bacterium]|nr:1-acyl-sn-glycerol-3-phosphate acyltransferase [Muribaculaceae bacterium]MDE7458387.1 1-acyl-sn-glycerol-3-phosphate acyltransferase [Muribaculaceae bacterium]
MNLASLLLRLSGWSVDISVPDYKKCIICVAPHTSNWDFILGKLAYASVGRKAGFLMKEAWFFWPLGPIFKAIGGIPVPKKRGAKLTDYIISRFKTADHMQLAVTPEGTRSKVTQWRTGFLHIAEEAGVPIVLGAIDAARKRVIIVKEFTPSGDMDADMRSIKDYYRQFEGIKPDKFSAEY